MQNQREIELLTQKPLTNKVATDMQAKEIATANMPAELKHKIAVEFDRLRKLHPKWKPHRIARKAGEKFSVKFDFE